MSKETSRRSPLGRARGLGSAKNGAEHWFGEQIAALAFMPLALFVLASFLAYVASDGSYVSALVWLRSPINAIAMILLILVATWHGAEDLISGIVEDYIHHPVRHYLSLLAVKSGAVLVALVGVMAVLKIFLGA